MKFLEEQAAEREQERDEAQREIQNMQEQLRVRDRDRYSHERVHSEVCFSFIGNRAVCSQSFDSPILKLLFLSLWCSFKNVLPMTSKPFKDS